MEIPKPVERKRGPEPDYEFDTLKVGKKNGKHIPCKSDERDRKLASIRTLCSKRGKDSNKEFKAYATETGVFYWREK